MRSCRESVNACVTARYEPCIFQNIWTLPCHCYNNNLATEAIIMLIILCFAAKAID